MWPIEEVVDMNEASQKSEVGAWGVTLGLVKKRLKEAKEKLAGIEQEYERKKLAKEKELQDALSPLETKLAGLNSEYEKRKQEEETKLQEDLSKRERDNKLRIEKIDAELRAKDALVPEAAKRGLTLEQYLEIVKRVPDLDAEVSRKEGVSKEWDEALLEKQKRHDKLDRQNKEMEEHWSELTTKLRFAGQLLQHNQVENQQLQEKISRHLALLDQLSNQVRELMGARTKLNIEVQEIEKKNSALEEKNVDLKKALDSLEERNAWLMESNTKLESALKQYLLENDKVKAAEIKREAQVDAEFNERKSKINRDIEKYIGEAVEKAKKLVKEKIKEMAHETREEVARRNELAETSRIRIISLATQLGDLEGKLKSEVAKAKGLEAEAETRAEDLRGKLESLEGFKTKFIDGKELTLEQAKAEFMSAQADEIKKRSEEKYQTLKSDYEARMPQLIHEKLIQILKKPLWPVEIANAIDVKAKERADGILRNRKEWPGWFMEYYLEEVSLHLNRALNDEFNRRVDKNSQETAARKLERLKSQAWPEWFSKNVRPVIDRDVFKVLGGSWAGWKCDKCGTGFGFTLTEHDIGTLLRNGGIEFMCPNSNCIDYGLLGWRSSRHKIRITLERLIARMMERAEVTPAEIAPAKKAVSVA